MAFHVQLQKDSEKSHAQTATSHSPIWTASITTSSSKCRDNNANSRVFVNNVTTANYVGRSSLREIQDLDVTNVASQFQMTRFVRYAEVFIAGTCHAIYSQPVWRNLIRFSRNAVDQSRIQILLTSPKQTKPLA